MMSSEDKKIPFFNTKNHRVRKKKKRDRVIINNQYDKARRGKYGYGRVWKTCKGKARHVTSAVNNPSETASYAFLISCQGALVSQKTH